MKLHKRLTVDGEPYSIVSENARLNLFSPGRAVFTVKASAALKGVVFFYAGYESASLKPWFIGYVESSTTVDGKQQRVFCRELTAVLYGLLPLALRECDLQTTLAAVSQRTGLDFVLPADLKPYTTIRAPAFYTMASGYHAMDSLAAVYSITKPIWQQQTDGKVFVGSWDDSRWPSRPVNIPNNWESEVTVANGAKLPAMPAMRPGALYNGNVLTGVEFTGSTMNIQWSSNPWAKR